VVRADIGADFQAFVFGSSQQNQGACAAERSGVVARVAQSGER
jgi:hypothetical protein